MLRLRSFAAPGPIRHACLRETTLEGFGPRDGSMPRGQTSLKPFFTTFGQVPVHAQPPTAHAMRYVKQNNMDMEPEPNGNVGRWIRNWSAPLVRKMVRFAARDDREQGPSDYPFSAPLHYTALREYPILSAARDGGGQREPVG